MRRRTPTRTQSSPSDRRGRADRRTGAARDRDRRAHPAWAARFARERERIAAALGPRALAIEHVGSTAVPGLVAKPIVDVLVTVEDAEDESLVSALEVAGYELRVRERGHTMVRTPARDVHVHLWAVGDPEVERMLRFRDRLREDGAARDAYGQFKRGSRGGSGRT